MKQCRIQCSNPDLCMLSADLILIIVCQFVCEFFVAVLLFLINNTYIVFNDLAGTLELAAFY